MFRDRQEAAERLAKRLTPLKGKNPLILAIPRGGVPMGRVIADALEGELDVVLVRKIGAPGSPEFAIGAVSEDGRISMEETARHFRPEEIKRGIKKQQVLIAERRQRYSPIRTPIDPSGRHVIVVDDGSATGATMAAALATLRTRNPTRLIAAIGVAPPDTLAHLETLADEVICLESPRHFQAVGQFFADFTQVEDDDIIAFLAGT